MRYMEIAAAYAGGKPEDAMRLMRSIDERLTAATGASLMQCTANTYRVRLGSAHHDDTERAIIRLWAELWKVRVADYARVMRERVLLRGAAVFGAPTATAMAAELQAFLPPPPRVAGGGQRAHARRASCRTHGHRAPCR
jgi:ATP/maltotriose-dependent transcriptional regulator MalT